LYINNLTKVVPTKLSITSLASTPSPVTAASALFVHRVLVNGRPDIAERPVFFLHFCCALVGSGCHRPCRLRCLHRLLVVKRLVVSDGQQELTTKATTCC
jgi:hypothetical protein